MTMHPAGITVIGAAALVLSWASVAAETPPPPHFEPTHCWFDLTEAPKTRCGRLYVPENRADPDSRLIALAVVVLPPVAVAAGAEPAPVVYLAGGPGFGSGLDSGGVADWIWTQEYTSWLRRRPLVLMDYRGTGLSEPRLDCPELYDAYYTEYARLPDPGGHRDSFGDDDALTAPWRQAALACRDRLTRSGIDLAAYDSAAAAADLADLRRALGYPEWHLWGVSYGTRVALALMRDHPEGIRTAILDSLYPPEAMGYAGLAAGIEGAFRQLFSDCAASPTCDRAYPDLEEHLSRTVAWLDERPVVVPVTRPDTGARIRVALDGRALLEVLFGEFYDWERIALLPGSIALAARRDLPLLRSYAELLAKSVVDPEFNGGQQLSAECREEFPFNPEDQMRAGPAAAPFTGFGRPNLELAACPLWGAGTADAVEGEPVTSDVPTLVLAGLYDPVTPPAWARAAMAGLPNGHLVEFPGIGHAVVENHGCASDVVRDFLAEPGKRPDPPCLRRLGPPDFDILD